MEYPSLPETKQQKTRLVRHRQYINAIYSCLEIKIPKIDDNFKNQLRTITNSYFKLLKEGLKMNIMGEGMTDWGVGMITLGEEMTD